MEKIIKDTINEWLENRGEEFSGVVSASGENGVIVSHATGYRNKAEELPNTPETVFGIASGTKLFTGLAICKLIDEKKLSLGDKLWDLLSYDLGEIDKGVTVHQLLTHSSGVGDYIDEESDDVEEDLQKLYDTYPVQLWDNLKYYLQMITPLKPKFKPGERYGYSNSGYVLLGLVVEAVSGVSYHEFVRENIIKKAGLTRTDFYPANALPYNAALGYMPGDEPDDTWRTNIFSIGIMGGSDGGIFSCAGDFDKLWRAIFAHKIMSKEMTELFLKSHVEIKDEKTYGLGVYHLTEEGGTVHFVVGGDSGVGFLSAYYPKVRVVVSAFSNIGWINGTYGLIGDVLGVLE